MLAEAGGRRVFRNRRTSYTDFNRAVESFRQPGSALKPIVYLTAFARGARLDTTVYDEPDRGAHGPRPAAEVDRQLRRRVQGRDPPAAGPGRVAQLRDDVDHRAASGCSPGAGDRARAGHPLASCSPIPPRCSARPRSTCSSSRTSTARSRPGIVAEPHIVERATDSYRPRGLSPRAGRRGRSRCRRARSRRCRRACAAWCGCPAGTAHALDSARFPIPVMGKTGTTSDFRDALFVGSTYGPRGITVAVRVGFDDNRELGAKETGGRAALPIFRDVMLRVYRDGVLGPAPPFPRVMEAGIDRYLRGPVVSSMRCAWPRRTRSRTLRRGGDAACDGLRPVEHRTSLPRRPQCRWPRACRPWPRRPSFYTPPGPTTGPALSLRTVDGPGPGGIARAALDDPCPPARPSSLPRGPCP